MTEALPKEIKSFYFSTACQRQCHPQAKCIQGICVCNPNSIGDGYNCRSPDECATDSDCTEPLAVCRKNPVSSKKICICQDGTERDTKGLCTKPVCPDNCHNNALCVIGSNKRPRCLCLPGFRGNGITTCTDCSSCAPNAICTENQGCVCRPGFIGNGERCIITNECETDPDCFRSRGTASQCVTSSNGSKQCVCIQGYQIKDRTCEPLGEAGFACVFFLCCLLQIAFSHVPRTQFASRNAVNVLPVSSGMVS